MKTLLQKTFYLLFVLALYTQTVASADTLKIEKFSTPVKIANRISQPINISFATSGKWRLMVESIDPLVRNQENPSYTIPINRVELAELGGRIISNFDTGKVLEVKSGVTGGVNSVNIALNTMCYDSDRPGSYMADLKFTLINEQNIATEELFNFRFTQEEIAKVEFMNRVVNLNIDKEKVFQRNASQNLPVPVSVYVSSNKNWKLYIRSLNNTKDLKLRYFVKVLGGDQSVNCNLTPEYVGMFDNSVLVASGPATINPTLNCLEKKLINVDYMVKSLEGEFIKAGLNTNEFEYRLETEN